MDRAINGVELPVYSYGKLVGTRIAYNDKLLMFMLRNRARQRFSDGKAGGPDAIDRMELALLHKKWRKEWEREKGREQLAKEVTTMASINAKIDRIREREEAAQRLHEQRRARHQTPNPMSDADMEGYGNHFGEPDYGQEPSPDRDEPEQTREAGGPRVRRLTDDGWV